VTKVGTTSAPDTGSLQPDTHSQVGFHRRHSFAPLKGGLTGQVSNPGHHDFVVRVLLSHYAFGVRVLLMYTTCHLTGWLILKYTLAGRLSTSAGLGGAASTVSRAHTMGLVVDLVELHPRRKGGRLPSSSVCLHTVRER
jgi:hypothetical protein